MPQPWEEGDVDERWIGYLDRSHFDPEVSEYVLRNHVKATTYDQLREREDAAVAKQTVTLRAHGVPHSYDLNGLREIHAHLFGEVYPWAGQIRTVPLVKGRGSFLPAERIEDSFAQLAEILRDTGLLRNQTPQEYPAALAGVYNSINQMHPFREGNGRTQREFLVALARENDVDLDWSKVSGRANDLASEAGRAGDLRPLESMFEAIARPASDRITPDLFQPPPGVRLSSQAVAAQRGRQDAAPPARQSGVER